MVEIGTDGGFLPAPVSLEDVNGLNLAPAERADVLIDFCLFPGKKIKLVDVLAQNPDVLMFDVAETGAQPPLEIPAELATPPVWDTVKRRRRIGLYSKRYGSRDMHTLNGRLFYEAIEELPELGSVEIWEIYNFSGELHPIHLHQVQFEVLDRRKMEGPDEADPNFDALFREWLAKNLLGISFARRLDLYRRERQTGGRQ